MSDFVDLPLLKKLNRRNPISRIEKLEEQNAVGPSARVGSLSELSMSLGEMSAGTFKCIDPATGALRGYMAAVPRSEAPGYHIAFFDNAGVFQWGGSADDGRLYAGAGAVLVDENGVSILLPTSENDVNSYKFIDNAGNVGAKLLAWQDASTLILDLSAVSSTRDVNMTITSSTSYTGADGNAATVTVKANANTLPLPQIKLTANADPATSLIQIVATDIEVTGAFQYALYNQTLGASAASINVYPSGNIPATGKDLHIRIIARTDRAAAADGINIEINDDTTAANYSTYVEWHNFDSQMNDQTPASNRIFAYANGANAPANQFGVYDLVIYDYAATNKYKEFQSRGGQRIGTGTGDHYIYDAKGSWLSTSAITKVELTPVTGPNFVQYTRVTAWLEG